jgi:DNA-binding IclR family transcriptional regulator
VKAATPEQSKTAAKVLDILAAMSNADPVTPQRLALQMGLNRTVTQRLLTTLLARGFVRKHDGQYVISSRVRALGEAVLPRLCQVVNPEVASLSAQTGETIVFQVPDGDDVVVLAEDYQRRGVGIQVRHEVGSKSPMTATASGLAVLAGSPRNVQDRIVQRSPDAEALRARIEQIQQRGFATTTGDLQVGVAGMAIAVGAKETLVGSLAVLVPETRVGDLESHLKELERCARRIESSLTD